MRVARIAVVIFSLVLLVSCSKNEQVSREELRKDLDAEFEQQTEVLIEKSGELKERIKFLLEKHEEMDKRHRLLDLKIQSVEVNHRIEILQEKHLEWEARHKESIEKANALIAKFEERHEEHEKMEESHGDVPLEQIEEEHEGFEKDLEIFKTEFEEVFALIDETNRQMKIIIDEHEEMQEKYR